MKNADISFLVLTLAICGGCGSSNAPTPPPSGSNPLTISTGSLVSGVVWQLNRPIEITLDRAVDFASVSLMSVAVETVLGGVAATGSYEAGIDPVTGLTDERVIRFQPYCSIHAGDAAGFVQGTEYRLIVRGEDSTSLPLRAQDGTVLASTVEVRFSTPSGTNPAILFQDTVVGPPRAIFRGRQGVPLDDPNSTRFELGRYQPSRVELRAGASGQLEVDPASLALVPNGLPLNHYIEPRHQIGLVVEFDQPVQLSPENLARIKLQYLDVVWNNVPCSVTPLVGCGRRGSAVRLRPRGTLPPDATLSLMLTAGFSDLVGEPWPIDIIDVLPLSGATEQTPIGARVDALFETFQSGGGDPDSMEDTTSNLGAPRGFWGSGFIAGIASPDGVSRVRSNWYPIGLAGVDAGSATEPPEFSFTGTDAQGVVRAAGGQVLLDPAIIGPVAPTAVDPLAVRIALVDVSDPSGLRAALPSLLTGDRARLQPDPAPGAVIQSQVFGVERTDASASLSMGYGCYAPGFQLDCAPWNLSSLYPSASAATVEITPQSFEIYTWLYRDAHHLDHRVTIRFDAARRDVDGRPDASSAYSVTNGWATDVAQLSGGAWDFLRFEVQFELDVSGDGYSPLERSPALDFIKVPIDFRR